MNLGWRHGGTVLELQGVLCDDAWCAADSTEAVGDSCFLEVVLGPDGLASVVLGDRGLEREQAVAGSALSILNFSTVEGREEGSEEGRREADTRLAEA